MSTTTTLDVRAALESLKPSERPIFRLEVSSNRGETWRKYTLTSVDGNNIFKGLMARFRAGTMDPRIENGHGWIFRLQPIIGRGRTNGRRDITWEAVQELLADSLNKQSRPTNEETFFAEINERELDRLILGLEKDYSRASMATKLVHGFGGLTQEQGVREKARIFERLQYFHEMKNPTLEG